MGRSQVIRVKSSIGMELFLCIQHSAKHTDASGHGESLLACRDDLEPVLILQDKRGFLDSERYSYNPSHKGPPRLNKRGEKETQAPWFPSALGVQPPGSLGLRTT